jgi:hypothetical protein
MTTRLFNGPTCMVRNWFVEIRNDGTLQSTAGQKPGVTGLADIPAHHVHTAQRRSVAHGHPKKPNKPITLGILVFDPRAVLRLLDAVAVLKARRENLKIISETLDEMRDQSRKGPPPERSLWVKLTNRLFATVDSGDINEVIKQARVESARWMEEFAAEVTRGSKNGWSYLVEKRDEGHEHLAAIDETYALAAEINKKVEEHDRIAEFKIVKGLKLVKLSMDVTLKVVGGLPAVGLIGLPIEVGYELVTEWAEGKVNVVGIFKGNLAKEGTKQAAEKIAEEALDDLFKKLGIRGGKDLEEKIERLEKLLERAEKEVWKDWRKAELNSWLKLWSRRAGMKSVMRTSKLWGRLFGSARWIFIAAEVKEKWGEMKEVWEEELEAE